MRKIILLCALASFILIGCKKKGCTDPFALNYNTEAEKDDETCTYDGHLVFWFTSVTATNFVNASIPNLDFYLNGEKVGNVSMTQFSSGQPTCGGSEGFTATYDLGKETLINVPFSIMEGGTSNAIQSGNISIKSTPCTWIEVTY